MRPVIRESNELLRKTELTIKQQKLQKYNKNSKINS